MKNKIFILIILIFISAEVVLAQSSGCSSPAPSLTGVQFLNPLCCNDIGSCLQQAANAILPIAQAVFPAVIIIGAIMYMTAAGNTTRLQKAHSTIVWASFGYAVILLASFIQNVVQSLTSGTTSPSVTSKIQTILGNFVNLLYSVGAWLFPSIILLGAWMFMTSGGEMEKLKKGRQFIIWGVVGLGLMILYKAVGQLIVQIV